MQDDYEFDDQRPIVSCIPNLAGLVENHRVALKWIEHLKGQRSIQASDLTNHG